MKHTINTLFADISLTSNELKVPKGDLTQSNVTNVLQLVFGLAGAIALVVITLAGLQYVLSQGNPQSAAKAKDTILYAIVGLALCIFGYAIVTFVLDRV